MTDVKELKDDELEKVAGGLNVDEAVSNILSLLNSIADGDGEEGLADNINHVRIKIQAGEYEYAVWFIKETINNYYIVSSSAYTHVLNVLQDVLDIFDRELHID